MKINTQYIKENVLPNKDYKRTTKRKFEYNNATHSLGRSKAYVTLDGTLSWRKYTNEEQGENYYVIDDGTSIIYHGGAPLLPLSCFDWGLQIEDVGEYLIWLTYKECFSDLGDHVDDLRDGSVAGFKHLLRESDIRCENALECAWELDWLSQEAPSEVDVVVGVLSGILQPHGVNLSKSLCEELVFEY